MTHKVGDRVRNAWGNSRNIVIRGVKPHGEFATVIGVRDRNEITVEWENPAMQAAFAGAGEYDGQWWAASYWVPAPPTFNPDRDATTRAGSPVAVERTGDTARPYAAKVYLEPLGRVRLTFDPNGKFYPGFELPHDLVNR